MIPHIENIEEQERNKVYGFKRKDFVIDNRRYILEYCAHTQDLKLTTAGYIIVSKRDQLTTKYEELTYLENGLVAEKIVDVVYETLKANNKEDVVYSNPSLPIEFLNLGACKIGDNSYHIEYETKSDLVLVMTKSKTVKTQLDYLDKKMPELQYVHSGKLKQEILDFVSTIESSTI